MFSAIVAALRRGLSGEVDGLVAEIRARHEELTALHKGIAGRVGGFESELDRKMRASVKRRQRELADLRALMDTRIEGLSKTAAESTLAIKNEHSGRKSFMREARGELLRFQTHIGELETQLLERQAKDSNSLHANLEGLVGGLSSRMDSLSAEFSGAVKDSLARGEELGATAVKEISRIESAIDAAGERLQTLTGDLSELTSTVNADSSARSSELSRITADIGDAQGTLQKLVTDVLVLDKADAELGGRMEAKILDVRQAVRLLEMRVQQTLKALECQLGGGAASVVASAAPPTAEAVTPLFSDEGVSGSYSGAEIRFLKEQWYVVEDKTDRVDVAVKASLKKLQVSYPVLFPRISRGVYLLADRRVHVVLLDGTAYIRSGRGTGSQQRLLPWLQKLQREGKLPRRTSGLKKN
eukprot:gnl/Dysnectes_brevis/5551_a8032_450.p1 GENE.gnl/Dysnectes_brevis/5551_a8032_450~~gnl/Dysnectes_brevis/5551_a8032_450.p1  ORF type:complete len:414 (-),score=117.98 gnl/Dysnectes_brevis/5551_a8032_450:48-1289(-)